MNFNPNQTEAYALVIQVLEEDPIRLGRGSRVFLNQKDALEDWREKNGQSVRPGYGEAPVIHRLHVAKFQLPHSWVYDTEPVAANYFTSKFKLEDGVLCERPDEGDYLQLQDREG